MKKKGIRWAVAIWAVMIVVTGAWLVSASAENVTFRDVKLENALKSALNTTTLTAAKLESLTTLDLSDKGITDLTGLEKAKNLKNISLRGNQISDISALAPLTLLETVDLTENQVRSLEPLSGLNNLRVLHVTANAIGDLTPIQSLKMLQFVFCEKNKLDVAIDSEDMQVVAAMRKRGMYVELGKLSEQTPDPDEGQESTSSNTVSSRPSDTSSGTVSQVPQLTVNASSALQLNRESGYLTGVQPRTAVTRLFAELNSADGILKVLKSDGAAADETEMIGTGMQVQLTDSNGKVIESFTVLLYGDVNGDGIIDVIDLAMMRRDIITNGTLLQGVTFDAANLYAWHMNDAADKLIDVMDLAVIRRSIIGNLTIAQSRAQ